MALGDVTTILEGDSIAVEILATGTAVNNAPTSASDGVEINKLRIGGAIPASLRIMGKSTAGSGTMTVTLRVWLYFGALGWAVGKALNGGSAIAETGTDTISYSEELTTAYGATRIYLERVAIAGTGTSVAGYAICAR